MKLEQTSGHGGLDSHAAWRQAGMLNDSTGCILPASQHAWIELAFRIEEE